VLHLPCISLLSPPYLAGLQVRRGALLALNCVAHNKPAAVRDALPELLPMLYEQTKKRPELVHQVDLRLRVRGRGWG